jgi:Protein of unknown function (DUF2844)
MKLSRPLFYFFFASALATPALAALGDDAASVEADRAQLKGTLRVTQPADYAVHAISTASGLTVHEYVSATGKVFAVSWHGAGAPDLRQLLGRYHATFASAPRPAYHNHHHYSLETPELVVQSTAILRTSYGRAWAPALLPPTVSARDIN